MTHYHLTGIDRIGRLIITDIEAPSQKQALKQAFAKYDTPSLTCSKRAHVVTTDCCSMKALADVADSGFGGFDELQEQQP